MNTVALQVDEAAAMPDIDQLTMTQQQCLKACAHGGYLLRTQRGYQGVNPDGKQLMPPFARRMINMLERNGFIQYAPRGLESRYALTDAAKAIMGVA